MPCSWTVPPVMLHAASAVRIMQLVSHISVLLQASVASDVELLHMVLYGPPSAHLSNLRCSMSRRCAAPSALLAHLPLGESAHSIAAGTQTRVPIHGHAPSANSKQCALRIFRPAGVHRPVAAQQHGLLPARCLPNVQRTTCSRQCIAMRSRCICARAYVHSLIAIMLSFLVYQFVGQGRFVVAFGGTCPRGDQCPC